jgi:hypothetical protein
MSIITRQSKGAPLTYVEADNNLTELDGRTKLGWRDNIVQLIGRGAFSDPPFVQFKGGIYLLAFSHILQQEAFASFHIDHDYAMGTPIYPHIHWSVDTDTTGTVRWGFEYTIAKGHQQEAFSEPIIRYVEQNVDGTPYKHYIAEVSDAMAIPGAGIEPDTIILCRVFRDSAHSNDTYDGNAFGMCVDMHYLADKSTTVNKSPNFFGN